MREVAWWCNQKIINIFMKTLFKCFFFFMYAKYTKSYFDLCKYFQTVYDTTVYFGAEHSLGGVC